MVSKIPGETLLPTVEIAQKRLSNDYASDFLEAKRLWKKI